MVVIGIDDGSERACLQRSPSGLGARGAPGRTATAAEDGDAAAAQVRHHVVHGAPRVLVGPLGAQLASEEPFDQRLGDLLGGGTMRLDEAAESTAEAQDPAGRRRCVIVPTQVRCQSIKVARQWSAMAKLPQSRGGHE